MLRVAAVLALAVSGACGQDGAATTEAKPATTHKIAGISPDLWKCESVAPLDTLAQLLGGPVHTIESAVAPPRGLPHPCSYVVDTTPQEQWTFDLYCRDDYKQRADDLFEQYRQDSDTLTTRYEAAVKAGQLKNDAGITTIAPERAADVAIGAKGLDHHGRGLIFIDDDAPCYVRVVGIDPQKRIDLAKLIAKNLTFVNAPMTPRPAQ